MAHSPSNGPLPSGPNTSALSRKWIRRWSPADWSEWMAQCRRQRERATSPLNRAPPRQVAFLRHNKVESRVLAFVTGFEARYLIDRLAREQYDFEDWREKLKARGEWRG